MKVIIVLMLLVGLGVGAAYYGGGFQSFDPDKEGRAAKAAITPGMSWTQVLKVAGEHPKIQYISVSKRKIGGKMVEEQLVSAPADFSPSKVTKGLSSGTYTDGFILNYMFSQQVAFNVHFDGTGAVIGVEDAKTMADLLGTREQ